VSPQAGQGIQVDWHMIAPEPNDPQTKTVDGVDYTYCVKCCSGQGMWMLGMQCHRINQHVAGCHRLQQQQWQQGEKQNPGW
jgi:hypothetical protein